MFLYLVTKQDVGYLTKSGGKLRGYSREAQSYLYTPGGRRMSL